ncbi:NAD(P)H-dependent oxidoreductase [Fodinicurvata sp. EGI_FJ10296]|uniref:NAD(P)H-dependent oxidoreductase n=1 Tax=Fodinicurvata sp. EGI_FJ10296 TaxID=3231908 RepID=UPI003453D422
MPRTIALIDGHPDPDPARLCHALADAYAAGATEAGHTVHRVTLASMDIAFLRTAAEWHDAEPNADIRRAQDAIAAADHLIIIYPLWLGTMPALLKAFLEQMARPGFAIPKGSIGANAGLLRGKSARVVVTMGMPVFVYRFYFFAHSLKSLERNILRFVGIRPIRETLIGMMGPQGHDRAAKWVTRLADFGRRGM